MPNTGKASKGCQCCRDRKVKCDLKKPSCSQCLRTDRICHGYRTIFETMFRDESEATKKRFERTQKILARKRSPASTRSGTSSRSLDQNSEASTIESEEDFTVVEPENQLITFRSPSPITFLPIELTLDIDECALNFFNANYVARPSLVPRGHFEWVMEAVKNEGHNEILRNSINALSLAAYANHCEQQIMKRKANAAHARATTLTRKALFHPGTLVKDSTLISVILLGMFESFFFEGKQSLLTWSNHVKGACEIIRRRDMRNMNDVGIRIFNQFYGIELLVALQTGRRVHEGMHEFYEKMAQGYDYDVQGREYSTATIKFFRDGLDLFQDQMSGTSDPETMIQRARQINRDMDDIREHMPSMWLHLVVEPSEFSPEFQGKYFHVNADQWFSMMWNHVNCCRLMLYKIIRDNLQKISLRILPPEMVQDIEYRTAEVKRWIAVTIERIIATVPQITGMVPYPSLDSLKKHGIVPGLKNPSYEPCEGFEIHRKGFYLDGKKCTGLLHLIWPLYSAGRMDVCTSIQRAWMIEMLEFIYKRIGAKQAWVLAKELRTLQDLPPGYPIPPCGAGSVW